MLSCFFREQGNGEREQGKRKRAEREQLRENWVCRRGNPGE
jgi:hypothetical protein